MVNNDLVQFGFDETTTADEVLAEIDLHGRTALVTGASTGIGKETAAAFARHGARVVITGRDDAKLAAAADEIREVTQATDLLALPADLGSLASVRGFTDAVAAQVDSIDAVVANAGVMAPPFGRTVDGFETQFGTNHLGHFVLVNRLVPLVLAAAPSRIVMVSSYSHRWSDVDLEDPGFETTPYNRYTGYARSKTANVLFAVELDRRLRDRGVRALALHPGTIPTELGRYRRTDPPPENERIPSGERPSDRILTRKSIAAGAATSAFAAFAPQLDGWGGVYLEDCMIAPATEIGAGFGVCGYALDPDRAALLWSRSEELVGEQFTF
jgi:NAD(P)-dependent dehydrogenase (short-subunit alcohol dehydrogenase family)